MIAADFNEIVLIDEAIVSLQDQLASLYSRRKSILHPVATTASDKTAKNIDLSSIDLSLEPAKPLALGRLKRAA